MPTLLLDKPGRHMHAEIVIDGWVCGGRLVHQSITLTIVLYCFGVRSGYVERKKLSHRRAAAGKHAGMCIQDKGIGVRIVGRIAFFAVIIVIAIAVHLQQSLNILIRCFPIMFNIWIKQIG